MKRSRKGKKIPYQYAFLKYLNKTDLSAIFNVAEGQGKLILHILYDTGMRVGELVTTRISDIDFDEGFIEIQPERCKTKMYRRARVSQPVLEMIRQSINPCQVWLLPGRRGRHLSERTVQRCILALAEEAGIQKDLGNGDHKVTPHSFRHSHIVDALMLGIPINAVQAQVGHQNLSTTQIYSRIAPVQVRDAYESRGFGPGGWDSGKISLKVEDQEVDRLRGMI